VDDETTVTSRVDVVIEVEEVFAGMEVTIWKVGAAGIKLGSIVDSVDALDAGTGEDATDVLFRSSAELTFVLSWPDALGVDMGVVAVVKM
jgi:hypothetical protein